ncbi:hypothetical protein M422DRAFT_268555 [Sphaerobolus stellatus SS14]|uniref:Uncharacterized protein n=1 Tax=Sphaerobolus stellatus (strain SS14) TaxID=990650 RepID=A0A0C9UY25_SPHS4|nr:hypothetical protein M422DRAFT_268555 [Sphaerobolus stellatus SS14]
MEPPDCGLPTIRLALVPVITATSGVILILRVNAIYSKEKWVKWLVKVVYVGQIGAAIFSIYEDNSNNDAFADLCQPLDELVLNNPTSLLPLFLSSISFDLVIFYLTLRKGLEARAKGTGSTLLKVLVRGGNLYFMSLLLVNFINVLVIALTVKSFGDQGLDDYFPWIGDYIGNINVQLTSVITSVIVSHLFLDLREAAYHSQKSYNNPSAITATVGEWFNFNQSESGQSDPSGSNIQPGCRTRENRFIGQRTLQDLMGYDDFAVDLQYFDDGDYSSTSEDKEAFLKEDFEVGV